MTHAGVTHWRVPTTMDDEKEHRRRIAEAVNKLLDGNAVSDTWAPTGTALELSADSEADFVFDPEVYLAHRWILSDIRTSAVLDSLILQISTDSGANFKAGASDYQSELAPGPPRASVLLAGNISNAAARSLQGEIRGGFMNETAREKPLAHWAAHQTAAGSAVLQSGAGLYIGDTDAINAIRIKMTTGTISGRISHQGLVQ